MRTDIIARLKVYGDKVAINFANRKYTYVDLIDNIQRMKNLISDAPGEVVALVSEYSFDSISMFFALAEYKKIIVPITSMSENQITMRIEEAYVDKRIDLANMKFQDVESNREKHPLIRHVQNENAPGLILFSSGTTGTPKVMIHNLNNIINSYNGKKSFENNVLLFLMFDHIGGLNTLFNVLFRGGSITIPENRDIDYICNLIERYRVTTMPVSPTFLNLLLISGVYKKYDLSSLSLITYGTEAMPESLLKNLHAIFPNVKFIQTFGTSETGIVKTSSYSSDSVLLKIDSRDENSKYKIVDGELWLKSKTQILGYLNKSNQSFTEDGWYKTGDQVQEIEGGYLKIVGRIQENINVGGQKVLPAEIETVLLEIEEVLDATVYGEKNILMGQIVVADVVMKNRADENEAKMLIRKFCSEKLEKYKVPVKINFIEDISFSDRYKKVRDKKIMSNA